MSFAQTEPQRYPKPGVTAQQLADATFLASVLSGGVHAVEPTGPHAPRCGDLLRLKGEVALWEEPMLTGHGVSPRWTHHIAEGDVVVVLSPEPMRGHACEWVYVACANGAGWMLTSLARRLVRSR